MKNFFYGFILMLALLPSPAALAASPARHVVLVVWDGMRPDFISPEHTPTLYQLARDGVMFQNHHPVYCSATEVNGVALSTGSYPAHSGIIANRDYFPQINQLKSVDVQDYEVVRQGDESFAGKYLLRPTLAEILRRADKHTAVAGSKDIALLHDRQEHPDTDGPGVDLFAGRTVPQQALAPVRDQLGNFPAAAATASDTPNAARDEWTTRALLGQFWSNGVPDFSLLWLSEPDFSQHAAGPGSPKALAALESCDQKLAAVLAELERRGLRNQTDIFVVSDHGFSTVEKSVDVCKTLQDAGLAAYREFPAAPKPGDILVVSQSGSLLFYVTDQDTKTNAKLVEVLQQQEFSGVVLSRQKFPGTFPLAAAKLDSPRAPDVVLSMRWLASSNDVGAPGMRYVDGSRKPNQGFHASLSRFDLHNTLVGAGPDLKKGFADTLPTGNVDLAPTILWLLGVKAPGPMDGRILGEALTVPAPKVGAAKSKRLEASRKLAGKTWRQYLQTSSVNGTVYLDEGNGRLDAE